MANQQSQKAHQGSVHAIVHMGFHKTGTTSLQAYLKSYRKELRVQWNTLYLQRWQIRDALDIGREYGQAPNSFTRMRFRWGLRASLKRIPRFETIIISREGFSGIVPGHRRYKLWRTRRYGIVSQILAREVVKEVKRRFGQDTKITLVYTLREREAWIRSVWGHVLRTGNIQDDFESFAKKMQTAPSLEEEVEAIARFVAPVEVKSYYLEDTKDSAFGPAAAVLELAGVPPHFGEERPQIELRYPGDPPHLQEKFLQLNRHMKAGSALYDLKQKLRKEWLDGQKEPENSQ